MRFSHQVSLCAATLAVASAAQASSIDIFFGRITNNNVQNPGSQFKAVLSDVSGQPNKVTFTFTNNVGIASSISEIYYDDRAPLQLLTLQTPLTQVGCNFTPGGANPGNLPGGNVLSPAFNAVQAFSADAQGNPSEGIDTAADSLTMTFTLQGGASFATVVNAISNGTLRIGLHVRAIGTQGGSDSFVNGNFVPVPPAAMAGGALMAGLLGIGAIRRRRA